MYNYRKRGTNEPTVTLWLTPWFWLFVFKSQSCQSWSTSESQMSFHYIIWMKNEENQNWFQR